MSLNPKSRLVIFGVILGLFFEYSLPLVFDERRHIYLGVVTKGHVCGVAIITRNNYKENPYLTFG